MTTITTPTLAAGETYVGAIIKADGTGHRIILLPGDADDAPWQTQMDWAASIGGDLPDRVEQALMYATTPDQFKQDVYWSNTQPAACPDYAWYQLFGYGTQILNHKGLQLRARAVRRVAI